MAIAGIGIDLVDIIRFKRLLSGEAGARLIARMAHPSELPGPSAPLRRVEYWAARWAAKEAFSKALGTGLGKTMALHDVGVEIDSRGAPHLTYSKKMRGVLERRGVCGAHVSISHTSTLAIAIVALENAK